MVMFWVSAPVMWPTNASLLLMKTPYQELPLKVSAGLAVGLLPRISTPARARLAAIDTARTMARMGIDRPPGSIRAREEAAGESDIAPTLLPRNRTRPGQPVERRRSR